MSDLLLMASIGLPRNGLVALYDPYRDVYGRNVLAVNSAPTGFAISGAWDVSPSPVCAVEGPDADGWYTCTMLANPYYLRLRVALGATTIVSSAAMEAYLVSGTAKYGVISGITTLPSTPTKIYTNNATYAVTGVAYFGFYNMTEGTVIKLRNPQVNLGPQLFPYSPPAGAPGTLQTSLDYSGNGNHLTLGATTSASTDDPVNTGTAWSFDGGDFLLCNGLRDALEGSTGFTLAVVLNQTSLGVSRGILSGAGTGSSVLGINFCDNDGDSYYPTILVNDGSTSAKALLSSYTTGVNGLVIARFIGGTELAIKNAGGAWVKDETSVPAYVKQSITVDWALGALDIAGSIKGLVGTMPLFCAWNRPMPDGEIARLERTIKGMMTQRGVTPAW